MKPEILDKFNSWHKEAKNHKHKLVEPDAVNIATVGSDNRPSNRMVLLKHCDEAGFVFYTNLGSRKASELQDNPYISMCFYWDNIGKQVRVEGKVELVSDEMADEYFASRALKSRIGAWASKQSQKLSSKNELLERIAKYGAKSTLGIKRPPFWSGYRVIPDRIEFWHKGDFRIHERKIYEKDNGIWNEFMLYP